MLCYAFLYTFEQTAIWEGWPDEEWAQALAPLLYEEAQFTYFVLPPASAEEYLLLKEQILDQCGFSSCQAAADFHCWIYQAKPSPRN